MGWESNTILADRNRLIPQSVILPYPSGHSISGLNRTMSGIYTRAARRVIFLARGEAMRVFIRPRKLKGPNLASNSVHGEKPAMLNKAAQIAFLVLIPLSAFATPKGRETITLQVVSSKTKIHSSSSGKIFSYTDVMFTQVNGNRVVYACVQRGDVCPLVESGKTYTADRERDFIYISMSSPEDKKPFSVKYKQVGNW